ncbi:DUF6476 family protein [Parvibaculum sp.]|uniref:DUF6476 family protein n=1 Tax=Parvibaculum sp. TaxID=2024848 RepID=UPI001B09CC03|nr:DUF6476 family protein [Parvibaculum sp.]MBO6667794.1 hypothetical protein [Parvibaculum sp.]MBO6690657.1 hypothetical protein [Parvibaculum sp.]MBO6714970.1 hypothetical protein [Parvibaculum sp.]
MSGTIPPDDSTGDGPVAPGGPLDEAKLRKLKFMMALMSGFLVLTFMVVVAAFVWRLSGSGGEGAARVALPAGHFGASRIAVAPGERLRSVTMEGGRIAIAVGSDNAEAVIIVDAKTGQELGRIMLTPMSGFAARE